ncbi:acyl-CoA dehydrogenase family protein [Cryobacterium sp. TMS1-20-1]|uniref:acyl-CoA dehydrogenase family protein n=1 Tax=Cryobacterium sp. TMS1-20-1 TaxID=1259223 RepID=UPI00141BCA17|nr:acyl-CoA dehydrogenase family protein [Cryobacterium sp. TMS1-20-1]
MTVATYIEAESPVGWDALGDAGWDLSGVIEDKDSATLRDLVEIAGAWGSTLIQLPLMTTILAKRHSAAAAETDGPITFSIPIQSIAEPSGFVPFGQVPDISIVDSFEGGGMVHPFAQGATLEFAPSLLAAVTPVTTVLSDDVRRELAVVWAAEAVGSARRVLLDAVEFAKQRQQFGKPIGSFQAVKHHLANAHVAAEFAETASIWASLQPEDSERAITQSFKEALRSVQLSIQVYGGLGFTWEMGLHFYLRHITTLRELAKGVQRNA